MADQAGGGEMLDNQLQVTEFISVSELANLMDVSYAEVIGKCMSLGMMVSINQRLEADVIELVAGEFGYTVEFIGIDDAADLAAVVLVCRRDRWRGRGFGMGRLEQVGDEPVAGRAAGQGQVPRLGVGVRRGADG